MDTIRISQWDRSRWEKRRYHRRAKRLLQRRPEYQALSLSEKLLLVKGLASSLHYWSPAEKFRRKVREWLAKQIALDLEMRLSSVLSDPLKDLSNSSGPVRMVL